MDIKILIAWDDVVDVASGKDFSVDRALELLRTRDGLDGVSFTVEEQKWATPQRVPDWIDEVWLFGSARAGAQTGQPSMLDHCMNSRGLGVFATGDHGRVGAALCGSITRVRYMRSWWDDASDPGPFEEGETRLDTAVSADPNDPNVAFDASPIPKTIYPAFYSSNGKRKAAPHEVLALDGYRAIRHLPSHQHEGKCLVPSGSIPNEFRGSAPTLEALALTAAGTGKKSSDVIRDVRLFGAVGVYDPANLDSANVGRIVVDSTFHHWIRQNIMALPCGKYDRELAAYYRNIARWLIPPEKRPAARIASLLATLRHEDVAMFGGGTGSFHERLGERVFGVLDCLTNTVWATDTADLLFQGSVHERASYQYRKGLLNALRIEKSDAAVESLRLALLARIRNKALGAAIAGLKESRALGWDEVAGCATAATASDIASANPLLELVRTTD